MTTAILEHINFTVRNSGSTAKRLCELFGWKIRWSGPSLHGGHSVHVGCDDHYLAVYSEIEPAADVRTNFTQTNSLNHIGVVVDDLDAAEARIIQAGYTPHFYQDYEPGRRFYFTDEDDVEYEVVSYAPKVKPKPKSIWSCMGTWAKYAVMTK